VSFFSIVFSTDKILISIDFLFEKAIFNRHLILFKNQ